MTIYSDLSRARYVGNGVTATFAIPFAYMTNNDGTAQVAIYVGDSDTALVEGKDYIVQGFGKYSDSQVDEDLITYETRYENGEFTLVNTPSLGQPVAVIRNVPQTQGVVFVEGEKFPAQDFENALDKLTMSVQEIKENMDRAVIFPPTSDEKPIAVRDNIIQAANEAKQTAEAAIKIVQEIDEIVETEVQEAKDNINEYVNQNVKPSITVFAETEMSGYANLASEQAIIATNKANEAFQSADSANNSAILANEARVGAEDFAVNAKKSEEEAKKAADLSKGTTITYWE
jgi:hypothetical protein